MATIKLMLILKKILLVLVASLFTTLLFATAWSTGVIRTVGTPAPIKKTLNDSGLYSSVLGSFLDQAKQSTSSSGEVSLTDPVVKKAANQTFTPQVLKDTTEKILDSTYKWLNGDTKLPDFKLDLSSYKNSFAANVAADVQTNLASLPACPTNVRADSFDALSATCLPKGTTAATAAAQVQSNLLNGKGFLDNPVLTANDLKLNGSNTSVFTDQLNKAPKYFSWLKKAPLILGLITVLLAAAIVFLSSSRAKGIRHISFTLIWVGALMLAFAWALNWLVSSKLSQHININNNLVLQEKVQILAKDITKIIDKNYWVFGGVYAGLGLIGLGSPFIMSRLGGRKPKAPKATTEVEKPAPKDLDGPNPEATKPTEKPQESPKKKTISIQ